MNVTIGRITITDVSLDDLDALVERYGDIQPAPAGISDAAKMLGRNGGLKGGPARSAAMTPERRSEVAKEAAGARWCGPERITIDDPAVAIELARQKDKRKRSAPITMPAPSKTCGKCGLTKPASDFHRNNEKADGLRTDCKVCHNARYQNLDVADNGEETILAELRRRFDDGADCVLITDLPWRPPRVKEVCWTHRAEWHYRPGGRGGPAAVFHQPDPRYRDAVQVSEVKVGRQADDDEASHTEWLEDQLPNEGDEQPLDELFPHTEDHALVRAITERDARFALVDADGVVSKSQLIRRVKLDAPREVTGRVQA